MQNYNKTISSLIRVARQLDDAGLYQQSDRVYDTLMRVAQISEELKKGWGLESGLSSFIKKFIDTKSEMPNMKARDSAIDKIITEYSTSGKIPSEFVDLFLKSSKFRSDLLAVLSGHDFLDRYKLMGPREAQNPWILQFPTLIQMTEKGSGGIQEIDAKITGLERQLEILVKLNPPPAPSRYPVQPSPEKLEAYREINGIREAIESLAERRQEKLSNIERLKRNQATFEGLKTDRKQAVSEMLKQISYQISQGLKKQSKNFNDKESVRPVVEYLKQLKNEGIGLDSSLSEIIDQVSPEGGAFLKGRMDAAKELRSLSEYTEEELLEYIKSRKSETGQAAPQSAGGALSELEKALGLTDENAAASQYPKAPVETPKSTQQVKGPDLFSRTTKAPGSKPNNIQRVRFKSPVPSSSAITIEELFKLVQNKPDRWEQFNNISKDPKLNLDAIKKLLKELSGKMGKGSIALSQAVKGLNLQSPYWQLAEPALEIAFNEFGKYLENPSAYSIENKYDYVNERIDYILSNKSISNKYKYFMDNYSSYKKLMDSVDWDRLIAKLNSGISRSSLFNLNIK
jgi:hypothetical protein